MNDWYIRVQGRVLGPFDLLRLQEMRERGQLQSFHEVSTDRQQWKLAGTVDQVFPVTGIGENGARLSAAGGAPVTVGLGQPKKRRTLALFVLVGGVLALFAVLTIVVVTLVVIRERRNSAQASKSEANQTAPPDEPTRRSRPAAMKRQVDSESGPSSDIDAAPARNNGADKKSNPPIDRPRPPEPADEGPPRRSNKTGVIDFVAVSDAVQRHHMVKSSVGLVLFGWAVTRRDGGTVELALSSGTCFAASPDGFLVTNRHVVEDLTDPKIAAVRRKLEKDGTKIVPTIWVFFSDSDKNIAEVRYKSSNYDLAVLKIDRPSPYYFAFSKRKIDDIVPDLSVAACGFPGLQRDIVNIAAGKDLQMPRGPVESQFPKEAFSPTQEAGKVTAEPYVYALSKQGGTPFPQHRDPKCIQHTAEIFHGNSGGPLLLENGTVVGINTYGFTAKNKQGESKKVNLSIVVTQFEDEIGENIPGAVWR